MILYRNLLESLYILEYLFHKYSTLFLFAKTRFILYSIGYNCYIITILCNRHPVLYCNRGKWNFKCNKYGVPFFKRRPLTDCKTDYYEGVNECVYV